MDNNLPDDCQSLTDQNLPWNAEEEEVFGCWHCGEEVTEESLTEVKTKYAGYQFISDCCIDEYITGEV